MRARNHGAQDRELLPRLPTVFSVAVELDDEPHLVAADPGDYLGAWFAFFGKGFLWLSNILDGARPTQRAEFLDGPITGLFAVIWLVAALPGHSSSSRPSIAARPAAPGRGPAPRDA